MKRNLLQLLLIILLFLSSRFSFGQNDETKPFQLRIAPLNLIDPVSGVVQLGVQQKFSKRWALGIDHGIKMNLLDIRGGEQQNYRYSKSRLEAKYFFIVKSENAASLPSPYLALEGFYFPQSYQKHNSSVIRDGKEYAYNHSNINRRVSVASFKVGFETKINHLVLDLYLGVGIRRLTIKHETHGEREITYEEPKDYVFNTSPADRKEGNLYRPHLPLGFKIGYILFE